MAQKKDNESPKDARALEVQRDEVQVRLDSLEQERLNWEARALQAEADNRGLHKAREVEYTRSQATLKEYVEKAWAERDEARKQLDVALAQVEALRSAVAWVMAPGYVLRAHVLLESRKRLQTALSNIPAPAVYTRDPCGDGCKGCATCLAPSLDAHPEEEEKP